MDATSWAQGLHQETHELWLKTRQRYALSSSGFGVFYSPVVANPALMIIGENPGGGPDSFSPSRAQRLPRQHEYFEYNYDLAVTMRRIFATIGMTDVLRSSVKLNLNFFRSYDADEWKTVPRDVRVELERFGRAKVREAIQRLAPKSIVAEGIGTYSTIAKFFPADREEFTEYGPDGSGRRIFVRSEPPNGPRLVGLIHPTGRWGMQPQHEPIALPLLKEALVFLTEQ